jgi:hypothetical protein
MSKKRKKNIYNNIATYDFLSNHSMRNYPVFKERKMNNFILYLLILLNQTPYIFLKSTGTNEA